MILNSYRLGGNIGKTLVPIEDFLRLWQQGESSYWVDIYAYETGELKTFLDQLKLSEIAMKCCMVAGQTVRFIPLREAIFFEFPVYVGDVTSELIHLSFLCIQNLIVTLHDAPVASLNGETRELATKLVLKQPTTSALVCLLLQLESVKSLKISENLKISVFELDERMDDDPDSVEANEILDQKRALRTLDTAVSAQLRCFEFTGQVSRSFLDLKELKEQFQLATSNAHAANQVVKRLEKSTADIRQRFEMNQQEKTNRRLAILTILSAIFMPLTFIAGIYGMNFDKMPELHWLYSYPVVLIIMALIAGGMYFYFKKKGWLE